MTQKAFWTDPYQVRHETTVTSVRGAELTLASSNFFAFAGGQESDRGSIAGWPVSEARKEGLAIIYCLPQEHRLSPGQPVVVEIDWPRRYRLMRLHFAAELVLELCYRQLDGAEKLGAHIAEEKARIDFAWPESITPLLPELTGAAQRIIDADLEIHTGFADKVRERRYWEVEGFARVACGGTHVRRTGEIGVLRLKRNNIGKGKERVEIFLDEPQQAPGGPAELKNR